MKWKITLVLVVVLATAFYFGYFKLRVPTLKQIEQASPVQVDSEKKRELAEIKDKTNKAITAASKELKKPDQTSENK